MTGTDLIENIFLENGIQAIELSVEDITSSTVWRSLGVPYTVTGDITVRHSSYDYSHSYRDERQTGRLDHRTGGGSALQPGDGAVYRQILE